MFGLSDGLFAPVERGCSGDACMFPLIAGVDTCSAACHARTMILDHGTDSDQGPVHALERSGEGSDRADARDEVGGRGATAQRLAVAGQGVLTGGMAVAAARGYVPWVFVPVPGIGFVVVWVARAAGRRLVRWVDPPREQIREIVELCDLAGVDVDAMQDLVMEVLRESYIGGRRGRQ